MDADAAAEAQQKRIIQVAFAKFDSDNNGMLDAAEIGTAIAELTTREVRRPAPPAPLCRLCRSMLLEACSPSSACRSRSPDPHTASSPPTRPMIRMRPPLRSADSLLVALAQDGKSITEEDVTRAMKRYDLDGSGTIGLRELTALVRDLANAGRLDLCDDLEQEIRRVRRGCQKRHVSAAVPS